MSLKQRLVDDMKTAMKAKDKLKLSVIRMARAAIKNAEIDLKKELDEKEVVDVLAKEVKMRRDSIPEYERAGRQDLVDQLNEEIKILMNYLPEQLTAEEIDAIVQDTIKEVNAQSIKDLGKVMAAIMPKIKGRADGKIVNELVRQRLS
ncbi:MAG TPA: GatB/YqeY domain-containing protein [Clostridia bacterium]|jgi:hypothetical protein|nr:GatB/YqeY domain-containing protein [Clostridia bacterium]